MKTGTSEQKCTDYLTLPIRQVTGPSLPTLLIWLGENIHHMAIHSVVFFFWNFEPKHFSLCTQGTVYCVNSVEERLI